MRPDSQLERIAAIGQRRASFYFFALGLGTLLTAFYLPWLTGQRAYYASDLTYYFEPFCRFAGEEFRQGKLPLWNPYLYCGMPQIAVPSPGLFYPLNLLFACLPFNQALALVMLVNQSVAGIGAYLLVLSFSWGSFAAIVAGLIIALSGYMFSLQYNYTLVASAAWLPLLLWALKHVDIYPHSQSLVALLVGSFSAFMLLSAGRPELSLPALLLAVVYVIVSAIYTHLLDRAGIKALKQLMWRLTAMLIGVMLAMPALLPALEWASLSARAHGLAPSEVFLWSANWYDLLCLFVPQPFRDLTLLEADLRIIAGDRSHSLPYLSSAYVGPVALVLAIWGACDSRWTLRPYVFAIALGALVMSLGSHTPLAPWLIKSFYPLAVFRYPVKLLWFPAACLAVLAARGAYLCLSAPPSRASRIGAIAVMSLLLLASSILYLAAQTGLVVLHFDLWLGRAIGEDLLLPAQRLIGEAGICAALMGLSVCALAEALWRGKIAAHVFTALCLLALGTTLLACAFAYSRQSTGANFFAHQPLVARMTPVPPRSSLSAFRVMPLYADPLSSPRWYRFRRPDSFTPSFYQYGRDLILPNTNIDAKICSPYGYEAAVTLPYKNLVKAVVKRSAANAIFAPRRKKEPGQSDVPLARFCQMCSTAYVVTQMTDLEGNRSLPAPILDARYFAAAAEDKTMNVRVYKVLRPMRRAYFASRWKMLPTLAAVTEEIAQSDRGGFDPNDHVLLAKEEFPAGLSQTLVKDAINIGRDAPLNTQADSSLLPGAEGAASASPGFHGAEADISLLKEGSEQISLSVKCPVRGFLVLTDQFYPGWEVRVDGQPWQLYRANAIHRAVLLSAGSHLVQFAYKPESLSRGIFIAALAVLAMALIAASALYQHLVRPSAVRTDEP